MMNKVVAVVSLDNFRLQVTFSDGRSGLFDVLPYLDKGIFTDLKDELYFRRVTLAFGGVAWSRGQDFSGDTIALEMQVIQLSNKNEVAA